MHLRQCSQLCSSLQTNKLSSAYVDTTDATHLLSSEVSLHLGKHLKPNHELLHLTIITEGWIHQSHKIDPLFAVTLWLASETSLHILRAQLTVADRSSGG